jgi:hypothetical protein
MLLKLLFAPLLIGWWVTKKILGCALWLVIFVIIIGCIGNCIK